MTQLSVDQFKLFAQLLKGDDVSGLRARELPKRDPDGRPSFAQERIWFLEQLAPAGSAYHVATAVRLTGALDVTAIEASLTALVARHDVLRTRFPAVDGQPRAIVAPPAAVPLAVHDLEALGPARRLDEAQRLAAVEAAAPFDLTHGPLLRATLLRLAPDDHILLMTLHHLVTDGWSTLLLFRELAAGYTAHVEHRVPALAPLPLQYADFAAWQRAWLDGPVRESLLAYWREQLAGAPAVLALPTDRPRPAVQAFRGALCPVALPAPLAAQVRRCAREEGVTLFMVLLAAFQALLARYTGQADIVVGTPMAHRGHTALEPVIGCFVNTLPLRTRLDDNPTGRALLARVKDTCLAAHAHQDLPFELLVDAVQPARSLSHAPLFQALLALQPSWPAGVEFAGMTAHPLELETGTAKFDLAVILMDGGRALTGGIEYNADLFDRDTITRLAGHYQTLLHGLVDDRDRRVSALPLVTAAERTQLLADWTLGPHGVSSDQCLHELVAAQAARTPAAVAVVADDGTLTYGDLERRANQLAHYLHAHGVGPDDCVGVCLERSLELLVALLGVLKAGGAYVPLDPAYPLDRLAFMLSDAGASVLLTEERFRSRFPTYTGTVGCLDTDASALGAHPVDCPPNRACPANLAYVIYTSGSTGTPKGVAVTHASVVSLFAATQPLYAFDEQDVWTGFHAPTFDFSVWEIWGALLFGGRLVMVPYLVSRSPEAFYAVLQAQRVTVVNQTPSAFRQLLPVDATADAPPLALRWVIFGGEALDIASVAPWLARHGEQAPQLINMYGITEVTVHATSSPVRTRDLATAQASVIGRALPHMRIGVLDRQLEPVPVSVAGELYIGGVGLARGYLRRPALTAARFIPDPFGPSGARLYRTGDLARWRADGALEFLGRLDHQVKIRGFRIELGEIEAALIRQPAVQEAVVVAVGDDTARRLVAYLVPAGAARPSVGELRRHLQTTLPDYMVPAAVVWLSAFPLTANGKLDRAALPAPDPGRPDLEHAYVPPCTPVEELLVSIWTDVLGVDRIGIHDNFFDLGGDSLRSLAVLALARQRGLTCTLQDLFRHQTIAALAAAVPPPRGGPTPPRSAPFALVDPADRPRLDATLEDAYPLAQLQAGMLYHMQLTPDAPDYHNINSYYLRAPFDHAHLRTAAAYVVARHPALRTSLDLTHFREPLQLVHRTATLAVTVDDLRPQPPAEQERAILAFVERQARTPFDVTQPPLLRLHLHRRRDDAFQLTLTDFHPLLDGWSLHTVLAEWFEAYFAALAGRPLPPPTPPTSSFREFVALEQATLQAPDTRAFWAAQVHGASPLRLPRWPAAARPLAPHRTDRVTTPVDPPLAAALTNLARTLALPLKTVLLAAHLRVLALLTGQTDILTGVVTHGRLEEVDGDRACGLFLNTLPLRLALPGGTWRDLLRATFDAEWRLLPHRRYPLAALQHGRADREPLFEVTFNYVHFHVIADLFRSEHLQNLGFSAGSEPSNFTLAATFYARPDTSALELMLDYQTRYMSANQVRAIAGYYLATFQAMVTDPDQKYETVDLLAETERHRMLVAWNDTAAPYSSDRCLHELIAAQARRSPSALAVVSEDQALTYGDLDRRANQLAHYLRGLGIGPDARVGVCLERSVDLVVALLGVLKAGGAYVPLDPAYPLERLAFMLADAGASALLTTEALRGRCPAYSGTRLCLDTAVDDLAARPAIPPASGVGPQHLAYVIYTSGSTGTPKGVAIEHRQIVNLVAWHADAYELTPADRASQIAGIGFDASAWEIWSHLSAGASVFIVDNATRLAPHKLVEWLRTNAITISYLPTALAESVLAVKWPDDGSLRVLLTGGEQLSSYPPRPFPFEVVNHYGLTECAVVNSAFRLRATRPEDAPPPIGSPIANTQLYVVDRRGDPVPIGVAGELAIGGAGVARGYFDRPGLTAARFVPDPFGTPGSRLYKTGDLARWRPDGALDFLGRVDQQVKIRGVRIELGEIEAALVRHPAVREAVVVAVGDASERRLIAYIVPAGSDETPPSVGEIRRHLQATLPDSMLPAAIVWLAAFPLTPNGKVDRAALPAPDPGRPDFEHAYVAPRTPFEERLVNLWIDVLGVDRIGVHDNFFELGGDSIRSLQIVARANAAGAHLTPRQFFEHQTIAELAAIGDQGSLTAVAPAGPIDAAVPLTPIQRWFVARRFAAPHHFNQAVLLEMAASPNLTAAWRHVAAHHHAFRLRFDTDGNEWCQTFATETSVPPLTTIDARTVPDTELAAAIESAAATLQASFDLTQAPLAHAAWFDCGPERPGRLLLVAHHLIVDAVSWRIVVEDLVTACQQLQQGTPVDLLPPTASFERWAAELVAYAASPQLHAELPYWLALGRADLGTLPCDAQRVDGGTAAVCTLHAVLTPQETRALVSELTAAYHCQMCDILFSALAVVLPRWAASRPVLVDVESHGRADVFPHVDVSRTVGWFTAIHPVLLMPAADLAPAAALQSAKERRRAVPHDGIGYGVLRYLADPALVAPLAAMAPADISVNYLGTWDRLAGRDGVRLAVESPGPTSGAQNERPYGLEVAAYVLDACLHLTWTYREDRYQRTTSEARLAETVDVLRALATHAQMPGVGSYSPSDFPDVTLTQDELDTLIAAASQAPGEIEG